jgi:pimeloyl-ACP methyl ester carboxylesterase
MNTVRTVDGVEIYYKDWGDGQPIVFSHGWPLSADDWDAQMNVAALKKLGRSRDDTVAAKPTVAFDAKFGNFVIDPAFFTRLVYEGV